jgi:peptidylprolyl isomerase
VKSVFFRGFIVSLAVAVLILPIMAACGGSKSNNVSSETPQSRGASMLIPSTLTPRTGDFASLCQKSASKQFTAPTTLIDPNRTYTGVMTTEKGDITIELNPKVAPVTVNSFVLLACSGYYDGVTFHRVLPGFVAQGGDPMGTGRGGPGYTIPDEYSNLLFTEGTVAMASGGAHTNTGGSQFFICYSLSPQQAGALYKGYTVFGQVTAGMDVVNKLTPRDPDKTPNAPPGDKILSISVQEH